MIGVYPRVCGGTSSGLAPEMYPTGLSPRVRGNPACFCLPANPAGSIPACAGEPPTCTAQRFKKWVYPRVCGGTGPPLRLRLRVLGLSPRVRGNHSNHSVCFLYSGSIPACAGEPARRIMAHPRWRVYPRVCGGTRPIPNISAGFYGLSPRVRGNRGSDWGTPSFFRSIPACAGEPGATCGRRWPRRVYPRVCGGTRISIQLAARAHGLSPRVRGNRTLSVSARSPSRSIPACAGEPLSDLYLFYLR